MPIIVDFESPPGTPASSRVFDAGKELKVVGTVTGFLGIGEPNLKVRLAIESPGGLFSPIFDEAMTSFAPWSLGRFEFEPVALPGVSARANLTVTVWWTIGGTESVVIPISIWDTVGPLPGPTPGPGPGPSPGPMPEPLPSPEPPPSLLDALGLKDILVPVAIVAAVGLVAVVALPNIISKKL